MARMPGDIETWRSLSPKCRMCGLPVRQGEANHEICIEPENRRLSRSERRRRFWNEVARWVGWANGGSG